LVWSLEMPSERRHSPRISHPTYTIRLKYILHVIYWEFLYVDKLISIDNHRTGKRKPMIRAIYSYESYRKLVSRNLDGRKTKFFRPNQIRSNRSAVLEDRSAPVTSCYTDRYATYCALALTITRSEPSKGHWPADTVYQVLYAHVCIVRETVTQKRDKYRTN